MNLLKGPLLLGREIDHPPSKSPESLTTPVNKSMDILITSAPAIARGSHGLAPSSDLTISLEAEISALSEHTVFGKVQSVGALRIFMEHHVFAVWDFMSLLKALQAQLAPAYWPWQPRTHPQLVRLVNEIVLAEESDALPGQMGGLCGHASHFEIYLEAMREVGADTSRVDRFIGLLNWRGVRHALEIASVPVPAREFVSDTFEILRSRRLLAVAAVFCYGRERIIPMMFRSLLHKLSIGVEAAPLLHYYLRRHMDVDAAHHGPAAQALVTTLCGDDTLRLEEASVAARLALSSRRRFLDGIELAIARGEHKLPFRRN